jgi:hypothetical protein
MTINIGQVPCFLLPLYSLNGQSVTIRRHQSCAGADERIEHDALAMRTVPDRICHHGNRFYRRMQAKVGSLAAKAVHAGVAPDVSPLSAMLA